MCGEQRYPSEFEIFSPGSPPRVRGTVLSISISMLLLGITPACAGNRYSCLFIKTFSRDHPRVCGEQSALASNSPSIPGSPPRVRGTAMARLHGEYVKRITPACAGNSLNPPFGISSYKDHPRVCGEQPMGRPRGGRGKGSPPRVRGTALFPRHHLTSSRITPACAGNSFFGISR